MTPLPTTAESKSSRQPGPGSAPLAVLLCLLGGLSLPALATTAAEDRLYKAPMPHETLGAGTMAKVHWVSEQGYFEGRPDNAARLAKMRTHVQTCVQQNRSNGSPSNPPSAWPDFLTSHRVDTYSSQNRTIRYTSGLAYGVHPVDCSLVEVQGNFASLSSSKGICSIDFQAKTAYGACDAAAHASASPPVRVRSVTEAEIDRAERSAAGNPAVAALAAAMRRNPPSPTGERKTILGLECDVWKNPFDPGGTICLSRGGSFVAAHAASGQTQSGMALETSSVAGIKVRAVAAKLDAMVNEAVFAPYLAGGFRITERGARK